MIGSSCSANAIFLSAFPEVTFSQFSYKMERPDKWKCSDISRKNSLKIFSQIFENYFIVAEYVTLTVTCVDTETVTRNCPYTLDQDLDFLFFEHRWPLNVWKTCLKHSLEDIGSEMIVYPEMQMDYVQPSCVTSFLWYYRDWNFSSDSLVILAP